MPSNDDYDDRPKRSWSEIDKMRDGKRSSSGPREPPRERIERSATYSRYKSAADQFFSGDLVPDALKEKLDPTGQGQVKEAALRKLKDSQDDFKLFAQTAKEFVDAHGLPEDSYMLDRFLALPNDGIVLKTLERLGELLNAGELKPPKSLGQRLKSIELGSDNPEVQDAAKALAKALRAKSSP